MTFSRFNYSLVARSGMFSGAVFTGSGLGLWRVNSTRIMNPSSVARWVGGVFSCADVSLKDFMGLICLIFEAPNVVQTSAYRHSKPRFGSGFLEKNFLFFFLFILCFFSFLLSISCTEMDFL